MADDRVNQNRQTQQAQRAALDQGTRFIPSSQLGRSPFLKVLDQTRFRIDQQTSHTPTTTGDGSRPVDTAPPQALRERDPNSQRESANQFRDKVRDSDRDEAPSSRSQKSDLPQAKEAEKRVIARGPLSEREHRGSGGKGDGRSSTSGQGERRGKEFVLGVAARGLAKGGGKEISKASFEARLAQAAKLAEAGKAAAAAVPQKAAVLSKHLIDQIVQYVHLVSRGDGEKEMDLSLHEKVFKALQLRVAVVRGKVEATFVTSSEEVRDLFAAQKAALHEALAQKGIDVRQIDVIMV